VSHINYEEARRRERKSACRGDRHKYGRPRLVGAGITRKVCRRCGAVTIDLSGAEEAVRLEASPERLLTRNWRGSS
jgi:hypothetical protein